MPEGGILASQYQREKAERDLATAWRQLGCGGCRSQLSQIRAAHGRWKAVETPDQSYTFVHQGEMVALATTMLQPRLLLQARRR